MKAVIALLAALCLTQATIYKGVDVSYYSGTVSQSAFSCMKSGGYQFVVIEAWVERHSCPTFTQTYQNAIAAGIPQVDAYAFICNSCMGGSGNVQTIVSGLKSVLPSGFNGRIWLDIEYASGIWSSTGSANMQFAQAVANALTSAGYSIGIYTNLNNWQQIMGSAGNNNPFSSLPLWYPRYDNNPNPAVGISNFGGWTGCTIKQYNENIKVCGINTDVNVATTLFPNGGNTPANNEHSAAPSNKGNNKESSQGEASNKEASNQEASNNEESSAKSSAQAQNPNASSSNQASSNQQSSASSGKSDSAPSSQTNQSSGSSQGASSSKQSSSSSNKQSSASKSSSKSSKSSSN